jgi:hypothetical protein
MVKNQSQTRKIRRNYFLTQRRYTYQESPKFEESQLILLRKWGEEKITETTKTLKITQSITTEIAKLSEKKKKPTEKFITTHASLTNDFIKTSNTRVPRT